MSEATRAVLRREVRSGDAEAIVDLHERIYPPEHGMGPAFVDDVRRTVESAVKRGWPQGGGAWLVERDGQFAGCLGLTDEGAGVGKIRWVLLEPDLRGHGLGRRMIAAAVGEARSLGMKRLELDTFGALRAAAAIYRAEGFRLVSEEQTEMWGPSIAYQHYVLDLAGEG